MSLCQVLLQVCSLAAKQASSFPPSWQFAVPFSYYHLTYLVLVFNQVPEHSTRTGYFLGGGSIRFIWSYIIARYNFGLLSDKVLLAYCFLFMNGFKGNSASLIIYPAVVVSKHHTHSRI